MSANDVVITGVGLVSSLGEGLDGHLEALADPGRVAVDAGAFAPFWVHPSVALDWSRQIPKKLDQNQMGAWQRLGTYAAGLALDMAGLKGDADRLSRLQMIVAAGGGERDHGVDGAILTDLGRAAEPEVLLNQKLMNELRPTLFLAQLSNLLAGNISIVHGVTGASRTFMGEEQCGVDAVRIAFERIRAGQGDAFLVGGSANAERADLHLNYAAGGVLRAGAYAPVDRREAAPGFALGSGGAFLVLEARAVAEARGATILAELKAVDARRSRRAPGSVKAAIVASLGALGAGAAGRSLAVFSGATGLAGATDEELDAIAASYPDAAVRLTGSRLGHLVEAQFPMGLALAVASLAKAALPPPAAGSRVERAMPGAPDAIVITSVGHVRGEGAALVVAAS